MLQSFRLFQLNGFAAVTALLLMAVPLALHAQPPLPGAYNEQQLEDDYHRFLGSLDSIAITQDYPAAVQDLLSGNTTLQLQAIQTLANTGRIDAIAWIVPYLNSSETALRLQAGASLDYMVQKEVLRRRDLNHPDVILIRPLQPGDPDLRPLAWIVLQMFRQPDDGNTHAYAASMTRYLELTAFRPELLAALGSQHNAVRQRAEWAIESLDRQIEYNLAQQGPPAMGPSSMQFAGQRVTQYSREWTDDYGNYQREVYYAYLTDVRHPAGHRMRAEILHGPFRSYGRHGNLQIEATYEHGRREGPFTIRGSAGTPTDEGLFIAGRLHGRYVQSAPDGRQMRVEHYLDGELDGDSTWWDQDGNQLTNGEYRNGEPWDGTFPIFDEDDSAWVIRTYDDGAMIDEQPLAAPWWW